MFAFEEALEIGVDRVEIDLEFSKDGRLVVIHDRTVDRTTNGEGYVSELTYEIIKRLDAGSWKSKKYRGARVPLLEDVFDLCKGKAMVNIDLKNSDAAIPMTKLIKKMKMEGEVVITGLIPKCVYSIRNENCFPTMFFESDAGFSESMKENNYQDAIESAIISARKVGLPGFIFHHSWINSRILYAARRHGLAVCVYDVNDLSTAREMDRIGVDSIMTDDPALIKNELT